MSYVLKSSDTEITINRSIIPETNDTVDIGSAERKIRDMYISNNSLWLGDDHKLAITSDGTMKFRKRDKSVLPKVLRNASGTDAAAINHVNQKYGTSFTNVSEFKLNHILSYAKTINSTYNTSDIFGDDTEDYEKEAAADVWQLNSSKIFLGSNYTNIGIGTNNPNYPLEVNGIIKGDSTLYLGDVNTLSDGYLRIGKNNGTGGVRSMIIHYDSSFNMCLSDYGGTTTAIRTPFKIAYSAPANSLTIDGSGDLAVNNSINFNDGSSISSNKLYLCKLKYASLGDLANTNSWVYKQNQFNSSFLINEGGFSLGTNGVTIPISGYYEIHIVNYFNNITGDRGSLISALAINGTFSNEDYICGSYIRLDSGLVGSRGNAGTITRYLTQGQQISTAWYETGDSSYVSLGSTGSSFTVKRIG